MAPKFTHLISRYRRSVNRDGILWRDRGEAEEPVAPSNTAVPVIAGTAQVGETLTVTPGTYTGDATITIAGNWQRDDVDISGAISLTYELVEADADAMIGYREVGTNDTGSDEVFATEVGPVAAAPSVDISPLTWAPPDGWESYTEVAIPATGPFTIDLPDGNVRLTQSAPRTDALHIRRQAGHSGNVVWIGGHLSPSWAGGTTPRKRALDITHSQTAADAIWHFEGILIDGEPFEYLWTSDQWHHATLQLQNVRWTGLWEREPTDHGDIIQTGGNIKELRIDKMTADSAYQGLFLRAAHMSNTPDVFPNQASAASKHGPVKIKRTNVRATQVDDPADSNVWTGHRMLSWYPAATEASEGRGSNIQSAPNLFIDEGTFWAQHHLDSDSGATFGHNIYPGTHNYPSAAYQMQLATDGTGTYGYWNSTATLVDGSIAVRNLDNTAAGRVYSGAPPDGDYVPVGVAGLSYVSPGYVDEPPPTSVAPVVASTPATGYVFGTTVVVNQPAGTADGDVLFMWVAVRYNATITGGLDGWTLVATATQTAGAIGARAYLYRKVAASEPASWSIVSDQSQHNWATCVRVTGANTTTPENVVGATVGSQASTTIVLPAVTPTVDDTLLLAFYAGRHGGAAATWTQPTDMVEVLDYNAAATTGEIGVASLDSPAANTTTGTKTATATVAGERVGLLIAVAPAV